LEHELQSFSDRPLSYNLNCWLLLFHREEHDTASSFRHTQLATARLRFLFLAAKIWWHVGRVGVSYSDHYEEKGISHQLMEGLRAIAKKYSELYFPGLNFFGRLCVKILCICKLAPSATYNDSGKKLSVLG